MFVIIICMAIVLFMPMLAKVPLAYLMHKEGKYDNRHPRSQQNRLEGLGARAKAAHDNCFEAICFFAPTVLLVLALDAHTVYTAQLCIAFVLLRLIYLICYWCNWHIARSTVWVIAMGTIVAHFVLLLK
uniref:MAPEG family protein n=1 Tax=Ningiella ruwaisensis TaxID=2364274 RepID=UPI0010A0B1E5|nr:MAPEG family protein [Ningiella ruwaisensis]